MTHDDQCVTELTSKGRWQLTLIGLIEREHVASGSAGLVDWQAGRICRMGAARSRLQRRCLICTAFR